MRSAERSADGVTLPSASSLAEAGVTEGQIARIFAGQRRSGARFQGRVSAGGGRAGRPGSLKAVATAAAGAAAARMGLKGVDIRTSAWARYAGGAQSSGGAVMAPGWAVAAARRDGSGS